MGVEGGGEGRYPPTYLLCRALGLGGRVGHGHDDGAGTLGCHRAHQLLSEHLMAMAMVAVGWWGGDHDNDHKNG